MNSKIIVLCTSLSLFGFLAGHSQDVSLPQVIPPSPDAAAIGKFGDIPVSTYTGIPNISIPLHSIKVRDLTLPISLSYHASGILVEQDASWLGLGWALNAGGIISRSVRGNDDLSPNDGNNPYPGYVNQPPFADKIDLANPEDENNPYHIFPVDFVTDICMGGVDAQPDIFSYSFLGYSGKFFLKKKANPSDPIQVILSSDSEKISIKYDESQQTWTIITKEGIKAIFGTLEYTSSFSGGVADPLNLPNPLNWEPKDDIISSWYLDKLISPTEEEITFNYDIEPGATKPMYASRSAMSISESRSRLAGYDAVPQSSSINGKKTTYENLRGPNPGTFEGNPCTNSPSSYSGSVNVTWNIYLKNIQFKNGELKFITQERSDIEPHYTSTETFSAPRRLEAIEVYQNETRLKTISFIQSYYNDDETTSPYLFKRLKLDEVVESSGSVSKNPYIFSYIGDNPIAPTFLPAKNTAAKDHWGLYNGKEANNSMNFGRPSYVPQFSYTGSDGRIYSVSGADRQADEASSLQGTLEKVTYPTGGHTKFFYQSHIVSAQESVETALEKSYYLLSNELGGHVKIFELNEKTGITINAAIKCPTLSCYPGGSNTPCDFTNAMLNDFYVTITDLQTGARVYSAPYSDYECKFYPNTTCSQNVQASLCGITRNEDVALEAGRYKLETHPLFGFQAEANIAYKLKLNANPQINKIHYKGGGLRISKIVDHDGLSSANDIVRRFDYTTKLAGGATVSSGRLMTIPKYHSLEVNTISVEGDTAECAVIRSSSYSNVPMGNSAQGSPIGYDKVTIHYGDNDENGYSVFTYKNDPDIETEPYLPNSPTTNHTVSNGLPLMEYHYTRDGFKVQEIENHYSSFPTADSVAAVYVFSTNSCGGSVNGAMAYKEYAENSEWWFLDTKTERTFDRTDASNARFLEVVSNYEYGPVHKMVVKEQTVSSEGQTIESNYYYPLDLQEPANAEMWDESSPDYKHMHATPLKQETLQVSPTTQFVGGIKYNYQYDGAKDLVFLASVEKALNTGVYETRMTVDQVDGMGNILQVRTSENVPISYLWGYDQTLPVAQVNNASWNQIYYEGFETTGTMTDPTLAHSGNQYQTSTFLIPFNPPAGQYELSYWKYENGSWVNVKEAYTASTSITGERLDDIRVYPTGAQMTTYDYDPLIGTITSSDVNNKPTHYKYDELQRLYLILDQDNQAVKGFNYQYKN